MKRFSLALPDKLYERLKDVSNKEELTVSALIRKYIESELYVDETLKYIHKESKMINANLYKIYRELEHIRLDRK